MIIYSSSVYTPNETLKQELLKAGPNSGWAHAVLSQGFSVPLDKRTAFLKGELQWKTLNLRSFHLEADDQLLSV